MEPDRRRTTSGVNWGDVKANNLPIICSKTNLSDWALIFFFRRDMNTKLQKCDPFRRLEVDFFLQTFAL